MNTSIILIGNMGTGKTSVGKALSHMTGLTHHDTDDIVSTAAGKDIASIFAEEGEQAFRDMETHALASLLSQGPSIISCGGGIVESPRARELLSTCTNVIYLWAEPRVLARRVGNTATRPKLANKDAECELANLQEKRTPLYEQLSTITIDTTHHSPQEIAEQIVSKVNAL